MDKKNPISGPILILAAVAVVLLFASLLSSLTTKVNDDLLGGAGSTISSPANDTFTEITTNATNTLTHQDIVSSSFLLYDTNDGQLITAENYTVNAAVGTFVVIYTQWDNVTADYDINNRTALYNIILNGSEGNKELAGNFGTVGTVAGIAVVILILLAAFGGFLSGKGRGGAGRARGRAGSARRRR